MSPVQHKAHTGDGWKDADSMGQSRGGRELSLRYGWKIWQLVPSDVSDRFQQQCRIFLEVTKPYIAIITQQTTHFSCGVIVINAHAAIKHFCFWLATQRTREVLCFPHGIIDMPLQTVLIAKSVVTHNTRTLSASAPLFFVHGNGSVYGIV